MLVFLFKTLFWVTFLGVSILVVAVVAIVASPFLCCAVQIEHAIKLVRRWRSREKNKKILAVNAERKRARETREAVKPLPSIRSRALSLLPQAEEIGRSDSTYNSQEMANPQVSFRLRELPFEIRSMIWKYAVGGNHIHIVKKRGRLGNVYCSAKNPEDPVRRDLCVGRDGRGFYKPSAWPVDLRPLSLILSCRWV